MTTLYGDAANEGKKHRISQLKTDGQEMDKFVKYVHRERLATEKVKEPCERRVPEVQATLEIAEAASTEEKAANESEQEFQETHQLKSSEAVKKVPMQSRVLESGSVEVNRAKDCIERSEDFTQWLAERDGWLTNLRVRQEQLRLSFQKWEKISQPEKEEVVTSPEASELKAEEPSEKLRELETYLMRLKEQTGNVEERCITTETKAGESSSLPCQLQTKLKYATTELSKAKDLYSEIDAMKLQLEECEKELNHALMLGASAESSLRELKLREAHMEDVVQGKKELEERLRWRNEQFQSLEEAHSKLRIQLKEKRSEWDTEKSALFSDIDSLHLTLDSKESFLRELQKQLQMVHHALSCEESRGKALELETAKCSRGLQQATAGYKEAQTTLETLRVQLGAEIGTLRNALGAKDRQLKDLRAKFVDMEQAYKELKKTGKEYQAWGSNREEQQLQLLSMKEEMSGVVEAHDNLRSRMKALEIDSGRERRGLVKALDQAHDHLSSRDETLKQVDSELVRVKVALALAHAQGNSPCSDIQLKQCEAQLEGACEEATTARRALVSLENNICAERSLLLESLLGKDKVIQDLKAQIHSMDQTISELSMHEEEHLLMRRDYEELQRQEIHRDAGRKSLESIHNSVLLRVSQEENAWLADRKTLFAGLQVTQERANAVEKQFYEVRCENERHRDVIRKLEARCAFHDKEMAQHCLLTDQTREQLALERTEVEKGMIEARTMNESLSAALSKKDMTVEQLKDRIENLEAGLRRKDEETRRHNERVSHAEKELRETVEVLCSMEEHIALMKSQACKTVTEPKLSEDVRTNLGEVTRKCQEESLAAKADLNGKLDVARRDSSVLSMQLTAVTQQLLDVSCQKELALKDLDTKESFLTKLTLENKTLLADRGSLEQVVQVLQIKKGDLVREVESSRATIKQLCNKYEAAQSSLASSVNEVKDLHAKLQNAHTVGVQLLKAEEENRDLEGYLKAAKAIAQDKEEKLAASEWTVQQLALDIGKAKAVMTQKDREGALMRDELADLERQLRAKEGAFIEMECYLEDALMSRVSMQRESDQLRQQMEDLDRGAADWKRKEQDMAIQLQFVGAALEEKRASLVACELEIKSGNDLREVMNGAIDSLKLQLADEQTALSAQQKDMNRLCEDLERSKSEASSASRLVKDLQGRLQQLEHSGAVRINQFQSSLTELRDELSLAHHQLDKYQDRTRLFMEESSRYEEKCKTLLDLNTRRDSSLKEMETQLFSARASALEQSKMLEQRDQDLQRAKEQRERQDQRQISLEDSLSRIQSQRCELQLDNEKLLLELRKLSVQLGVSSTEVALKSEEIQSLHIQLEQTRLLAAQERERQTLMTTLVDEAESPQVLQEREGCLRAVQSSLHEAEEKRQVLQGNLVGKESDTEIFVEKLSTPEKRSKVPEEKLSKLQEALTLAQSILSGKSEISSLHFRAINAVEEEIASRKEKPGSNFNETSSLTQELHGASSLALESEEIVFELQETLEGMQSELKANAGEFLHAALVEDTQSTLKEWTEKSAVVLERKVALNESASKGVTVKALGMDMTLKSREDEGSKGDVVMTILQGELATQIMKEAAAWEFARQLKVTQDRAEFYQQQVCDLQEVLRKSAYDLKEKIEQNSFYISLFSALQDEWLEMKSRVATAEGKVVSLKIQLEDAEEKRFRCHQEVEQVNEAMIRLEYELIEERENALGFTLLQHALNDEMTKVVESTSLIRDIQAQAEAWKDVADDPHGDKMKQGVGLIKEAPKLVEHGQLEDRMFFQLPPKVEDDLLDERMKAAEFAALNIQLHVEGWKSKAEDAAKEGERVNRELKCAGSTISSLLLQIETHQRVERAMKELIDSLQVDINVSRKVAYARREKMEIFLHELEKSQDGEKELLENLQMEQKRLSLDVVDDGGFDCTFDIDAYLKMPIQGPGNTHNIRAAKFGIRDDGIRPKFHLEEFQNSAEECSFGRVNEALENELENLRLHAEESQRRAQEVCGKLDAALSDVATKNLIIKQVNDEISGLRSLLKRVEQDTMSVQDSLHGEGHQYSTDASILTTGRDDRQQSTNPGKRKAEIQEELNSYLDLCGSLVRKNVRLEKQLDGLRRKNRGLQMQVEGFQSAGMSSSNKERRAEDPADCSTEQILLGFSPKTDPSVFKADVQERRMVTLQNICTGNVLGETDENAEPRSLERCPVNQKPPVNRRPAMQQRKQNA